MYKNLIILSIDSLRADSTSYTHRKIHHQTEPLLATPNLDKFSKHGSYFQRAYSTNTYTTAAHASLFTGRYPYDHKVRAFFDFNQSLNPDLNTLAEILTLEHFQTFFYSDIPELFSEMDIWRGFRVKTKHDSNRLFGSLEELKKDRNFIFFHLFDIHEPYLYVEDKNQQSNANSDYYDAVNTLRREINLRSKINQKTNPYDSWQEIRKHLRANSLNEKHYLYPYYLAGVNNFDQYRLPSILNSFAELGFTSDNTLFVLLSDHGEGQLSFGNDNYFAHAGEITEDVLRIYLSLSHPGIKHSLLSLVDLKNICLSLLQIPNPSLGGDLISRLKVLPGHIYAESFYNYVGNKLPQGLTDKGSLVKIAKKKHIQPEYVLGSRALINQSSKLVLHGEPEYLFRDSSSPEPFELIINRIYQSILYRFPDLQSQKSLLKAHLHSPMDKEALANEILNSQEKSLKPFIETLKINNFVDRHTNDRSWLIKKKIHWLSILTHQTFSLQDHRKLDHLISKY